MRAYVAFHKLSHLLAVVFVAMVFGIMSRFDFGRKLLLNHPKFFSGGFVSHEGPSEATNENTSFEMIFHGEGWKERIDDPDASFDMPPNKKITTRVVANNPGENFLAPVKNHQLI